MERACWKAWEAGFRAGAAPHTSITTNPYSYDGVERPGPPPFPEFTWSDRDRLDVPFKRWAKQMREFKIAWDEWAAGLR